MSYSHHFAIVIVVVNFLHLIISYEATEPYWTKVLWNGPWVNLFQNCVRLGYPSSNMAAATGNRNIYFEDLLWNHWFNFAETWLEGSLVLSLKKLLPSSLTTQILLSAKEIEISTFNITYETTGPILGNWTRKVLVWSSLWIVSDWPTHHQNFPLKDLVLCQLYHFWWEPPSDS